MKPTFLRDEVAEPSKHLKYNSKKYDTLKGNYVLVLLTTGCQKLLWVLIKLGSF